MSEQINWICVFKSSNRFEAEAVKGNFESAEIPCVMLNKQDSSYLAFGYIELHVPDTFKQQAEQLLTDQLFDN
jgi:hypothetical protein